MAYGGENESMWSEKINCFNRHKYGKCFGKPMLTLNVVCWMNPWAMVEKLKIPSGDVENTLHIFFYHEYSEDFRMNNFLNVIILE